MIKNFYQLTSEVLQNVANDELSRDLTEVEIRLFEEKIGYYVDWNGAIQSTIFQNNKK